MTRLALFAFCFLVFAGYCLPHEHSHSHIQAKDCLYCHAVYVYASVLFAGIALYLLPAREKLFLAYIPRIIAISRFHLTASPLRAPPQA